MAGRYAACFQGRYAAHELTWNFCGKSRLFQPGPLPVAAGNGHRYLLQQVTATVSPTRGNSAEHASALASTRKAASDRTYTVRCALGRAVADPGHLAQIRDAVARVHTCTYHATDLLNLYVRDRLEHHDGTGLEGIFTQNWLVKAFQTVSTTAKRTRVAQVDANVQAVFDRHMRGTFTPPSRSGLTQAINFVCDNLGIVGAVNVHKHFQKRVLSYTRTVFALDEGAYAALSKDERRARKLELMQAANDVCRAPAVPRRSPETYHEWVDATRGRLGIDAAVGGDWGDQPLLYHLKAKPHRFLHAMHVMSMAQHAAGRKAFALFPLRRTHVPRHVRFDQKALDALLRLGAANAVAKAKKARGPHLDTPRGRAPKRKRDDPGPGAGWGEG